MKRSRVFGAAAISAISVGALCLTGGCAKDQEVLKDRPMIPPPTNVVPKAQEPQPVVIAPAPVIPELKPAPVKPVEEKVVPK